MRMLTFSRRCAKEILRDPINLGFGLGFPLALLLLLTTIQANVPVTIYTLETLTPGITVFGLSFLTLFSATLVSRDRESALLQRLYTTPLTAADFILGYLLPLIPMALGQTTLCYLAAIALGLAPNVNILYAILAMFPMVVFNISLGLLCGSCLGAKQVGGICGALLTNLSAWLSGIWFDLSLMGAVWNRIANGLPFVHAVEMERAILAGKLDAVAGHILPILVYSILTTAVAIHLFLRQMRKQ